MTDTGDMATKNITAQGLVLKAPMPYEAGHVLVDNEAAALNQTFLENLRNNFSSKIAKLVEDHNKALPKEEHIADGAGLPEDVQATIRTEFVGYAQAYEFGAGRGREADPIRAQAMDMAKEAVRAHLKANGFVLSEVGRERITELAEQAIDRQPNFMIAAERLVKARQDAQADTVLPELD